MNKRLLAESHRLDKDIFKFRGTDLRIVRFGVRMGFVENKSKSSQKSVGFIL